MYVSVQLYSSLCVTVWLFSVHLGMMSSIDSPASSFFSICNMEETPVFIYIHVYLYAQEAVKLMLYV